MAKATTGFTLTAVVVVNFLRSFFFWSRRQTKLRISDRVTARWGRQPSPGDRRVELALAIGQWGH